jgi:hypothetical protein
MGKVIFKKGEVQELHGTFGGMIFRGTANGGTVVHLQRRLKDKRGEAVRRAVAMAQGLMYRQGAETVARMQEIADCYHAMRQVINEWYEDYAARIQNFDKLVEALAVNYCNKFAAPKLDLTG